jgi:hypothetical protein
MNENDLIRAIRIRATERKTRTDFASEAELAPRATPAMIEAAEAELGFALHPFHRRLLLEIANGGFGPGDGLLGVPGGRTDDDGRSLLELRRDVGLAQEFPWRPAVVTLCDWGCGQWSCVDAQTGTVLFLDEYGLTDTGQRVEAWFTDWVAGVVLSKKAHHHVE